MKKGSRGVFQAREGEKGEAEQRVQHLPEGDQPERRQEQEVRSDHPGARSFTWTLWLQRSP